MTPQEFAETEKEYTGQNYSIAWKESLELQDGSRQYQAIWFKLP